LETSFEEVAKVNPHLIPKEKALASLHSFLASQNVGVTKSGLPLGKRTVKDITCVSLSYLATKSSASVPEVDDADELIYLVNFDDEQGYAMLAADDRISSDILAVVDEGSITAEDVINALQPAHLAIHWELHPEGEIAYDTLYFDVEDSIAIMESPSPALFKNYYETYGEPLIGSMSASYNDPDLPKSLTTSMCLDLVFDQVTDDSNDNSDDVTTNATSTTAYGPDIVFPILKGVTDEWHQGSPFNDLCPIIWFSGGERTPAGCVPLALAQIMTYFKYPDVIMYNNKTVDWNELRTGWKTTAKGKESAAVLLRTIGSASGTIYFSEGSFTFPSSAECALSCRFKYKNVEYEKYKDSTVVKSLNNDCPVFVCSVPHKGCWDYDFYKSHAWILDGYRYHYKTTTTTIIRNGVVQDTLVKRETLTMVHCNFGWGRLHNGYFVSGIFDLKSEDAVFDDPTDPGRNINYNWYLRTITYDNPRK
jgi:hypothetical protein